MDTVDVLLTIKEVVGLGWSTATIWREDKAGRIECVRGESKGRRGQPPKLIRLSSLPIEMQIKWAKQNPPDEKPVESSLNIDDQAEKSGLCETASLSSLDRLNLALLRFPADERDAWLAELNRLSAIVQRYEKINPKRVKNAEGKYEFVAEIGTLCNEAACSDRLSDWEYSFKFFSSKSS